LCQDLWRKGKNVTNVYKSGQQRGEGWGKGGAKPTHSTTVSGNK